MKSGDIVMANAEKELVPSILLKKNLTSFLSNHTIYEAIPENMKILVFNSELSIKEVIKAMAHEDIFCGLIYDSEIGKYIGLMTIRDLITFMKFMYDKMSSKTTPILNINDFLKETFGKSVNQNTLEVIKEDRNDLKTNSEGQSIKSSFMDVDDSKSLTEEDIEKDYKEFFKCLAMITLSDFLTTVKKNTQTLLTLSIEATLIEAIHMITENTIHRLIIEDPKSKNYTGFVTYETIFEYLIENYVIEESELNLKLKEFDCIITHNLLKFDKKEKIYNVFEKCLFHKMSLMPIYDFSEGKSELFGFLFLKDIVYFFTNSRSFSFNDTVEKFLTKLYEGIDEEKPLGKDRINIITNTEELTVKEIFEMMTVTPEKRIIVLKGDDLGVITLSSIFKNIINLNQSNK